MPGAHGLDIDSLSRQLPLFGSGALQNGTNECVWKSMSREIVRDSVSSSWSTIHIQVVSICDQPRSDFAHLESKHEGLESNTLHMHDLPR
jgi:hypothetical protein